jgi:hypothetical protein
MTTESSSSGSEGSGSGSSSGGKKRGRSVSVRKTKRPVNYYGDDDYPNGDGDGDGDGSPVNYNLNGKFAEVASDSNVCNQIQEQSKMQQEGVMQQVKEHLQSSSSDMMRDMKEMMKESMYNMTNMVKGVTDPLKEQVQILAKSSLSVQSQFKEQKNCIQEQDNRLGQLEKSNHDIMTKLSEVLRVQEEQCQQQNSGCSAQDYRVQQHQQQEKGDNRVQLQHSSDGYGYTSFHSSDDLSRNRNNKRDSRHYDLMDYFAEEDAAERKDLRRKAVMMTYNREYNRT